MYRGSREIALSLSRDWTACGPCSPPA